jgi:periplasmic divalent cation tolerance protein
MSDQIRLVISTAPDPTTAEKLARGAVEARLAACVNVLPGAVSFYFWEGQMHRDAEFVLLFKSREKLLPELTRFIREKHPAKLPEVIALSVSGGDKQYLDWVVASTNPLRPQTA